MMKEIISNHDGIGLFGILSLLLFFAAFTIASVKAWGMSEGHAQKMAQSVVDEEQSAEEVH